MRITKNGLPDRRGGYKMPKGSKGPAWKGGVIHINGYKYVEAPGHPHKLKNGYMAEHRLVMEKKIGRYLLPSEDVHHIDKNKLNNDPDNLEIMTRSEHWSHHQRERWERWRNNKISKP